MAPQLEKGSDADYPSGDSDLTAIGLNPPCIAETSSPTNSHQTAT